MDQDTDFSGRTPAASGALLPAPFSGIPHKPVVDTDFVALNGKEQLNPKLDTMPFAGPGAAAAGSLEANTSPGSVIAAPLNGAAQSAGLNGPSQSGVLDAMPLDMPEAEPPPPPKRRLSRQRLFGVGLLIFGVTAALLLGLRVELNKSKAQNASQLSPAAQLKQQELPLSGLNNQSATAPAISSSSVRVNGTLVLTPTVQPSKPLPGQFYYDQSASKMFYYDGTGFVPLQGGNTVTNNTYNNSTVTNNYANSTVNNTTNNTFVTNNVGASITGTPGTLAMFNAGGNSLADSLITQTGTTVNVASTGTNVVNVGSSTGTSITAVQGGLGGVSVVTGTQAGSSGNITIMSGASTTTAAGNVTVDTGNGFVSGTVVENLTFESGTDNINPWTGSPLPTVVQNCTVSHSGNCSLSVSGPNFWGVLQPGDPSVSVHVTPGHHYFISMWARAATGATPVTGALMWNVGPFNTSVLSFPTISTTTTGWTQYSSSGIAPAGATLGTFRIGGVGGSNTNGVQYFDDITVTDLSTGTASSELNLGATNAQIITIGNMNEIGPTTIYGGSGITMTAGSANVDVNGGAILVNGSGASSFSTSSGSLTLSAGGGTGGGVIVQTQAASTSAFAVQTAGGGTTMLNVDTTNLTISLGTGAGTSIGYTSVGTFTGGDIEGSIINAQKVTTTAGGTISSMSAYFLNSASPNNLFQFALYADNGSGTAPGAYIASSSIGTMLNPGQHNWYTLPISATLASTTTYWLVFWSNADTATSSPIATSNGGASSLKVGSSGTAWQTGPDNGFPATFPALTVQAAQVASLYASYTSSGPALTVNRFGTVTANGAVLFQDPTNSTVAFQVQDSLGNALLTADTADGYVSVTTLVVTGHIVTGGAAPSIAAGAAACTTPTVSVAGTDTSGTITVTTGTGCAAAGKLATVTFATAFAAAPHVVITPGSAAAAGLSAYVDSSTIAAASFDIDASTAPANSTAYKWSYVTVQ